MSKVDEFSTALTAHLVRIDAYLLLQQPPRCDKLAAAAVRWTSSRLGAQIVKKMSKMS